MLSGTARVMKCVPPHVVAEQLRHLVLSIILGFHALKGCNTMLPLSGNCKNTCWKMFIKYAHLLTGVVRDDNVDDAWGLYVCCMGLEKRMSVVLMMPGIVFFCESGPWPRCVASSPWCIRVTYHKGKLLS